MKFFLMCSLLGLILVSGCSPQKEVGDGNRMELDSTITNFVREYIKVNKCNKCLNDITIDKILPDSTIITIRTQISYKRYFQENPIRQMIKIDDVPFFLYTGAEQFRKDIPSDSVEIFFDGSDCSLVTWTIINSKGISQLLKYGGEPFYYPDFNSEESAPKNIRFLPPDGEK